MDQTELSTTRAPQHHDGVVGGVLDEDEAAEEKSTEPSCPTAPKLVEEECNLAFGQDDGVQVGDPKERGHLEEDEKLAPACEVRRLPEQDEIDE